jgi:uncharacterized protein
LRKELLEGTDMAEETTSTNPVGLDKDAKMWAMFCHLAAFAGYLIPLGNIIGPLIVWQIKKEMPFVDANGKKALNWQITVMIAALICIPLVFACGIGAILLIVVGLANLILIVIAALKANNGEDYNYPWSLKLIK